MNGFSAVSESFGIHYALFSVAYCNFLGVWWVAFSSDIDQRLKPSEYKFSYSDLYSYHRADISRYHRYYLYLIFMSAIPVLCNRIIYDDIER